MVTPLELLGFCKNVYFSHLIEAQRHAQYRAGFAFVSCVDFGHRKRAGNLGGRQITAPTAVGLGHSQRAVALCVAVGFLSTRPTSVLFASA